MHSKTKKKHTCTVSQHGEGTAKLNLAGSDGLEATGCCCFAEVDIKVYIKHTQVRGFTAHGPNGEKKKIRERRLISPLVRAHVENIKINAHAHRSLYRTVTL